MKLSYSLYIVILLLLPGLTNAADHVIIISADGLRPDAITKQGEAVLPNFYRFRKQGVWTDNARADYHYTRTIPNHSTILTARPVMGTTGHAYFANVKPDAATTLHNNNSNVSYIYSIFDVAHDHGLSTVLYAGKSKFILFKQSYNEQTGAKDMIGRDNGNDKIDTFKTMSTGKLSTVLVSEFVNDMKDSHYNLSLLHLTDPDRSGHRNHWTEDVYLEAVQRVDGYLNTIFQLVEDDSKLKNNTTLILVSDHGGTDKDHSDVTNSLNYTIPFYVWGPNVARNEDLYKLNTASRQDPGVKRYKFSASIKQPIRNGDAANLALSILGLPAVPDGSINARQDLQVSLGN